ncbi:hypothetical protein [Stutzerimonas chloritidismutans]
MEKSKCFGQTRTTGLIWSLLAALLLFASPVRAEDYYWSTSPTGAQYPDVSSACSAQWSGSIGTYYKQQGYQDAGYIITSSTSASCQMVQPPSTTKAIYTNVTRYGSVCPEGTIYNQHTGRCDPPEDDPCLPTTGNKITHRHKLGEIILGTIPYTPPPPSVCSGSCVYSDPELDGKPYRFVSNSPTGAWANYSYFGDGKTCESGETEVDAPSENKPVADKENKCTNKVCLTVDEAGNCQTYTYSCTATETYTDPGNMDCDFGQVDGKAVCVPNSPAPKLTETEVKTDVKETTNPDGSKETETTTTTNKTICSGVDSCKTTTTTNVSNNKTNADGTDGGSSSTCTGSDCKAGDGKSQEDEQEEEESESRVTGGNNCDAPPVCTGDAIQCAILSQTHKQRCADQEFQEVDGEKLAAEVGAGFEGSEFKPFGEGERGNFDLTGMIDTSSTIGGSCPVLPPITFTIQGVTKSVDFGTVMAELCKYASWFSYLMVAFAMRRAAEIVAGGMA